LASTFSDSISDEALAARILAAITKPTERSYSELRELVRRATDERDEIALKASRVFFREVVEKSCDLFDPAVTRGYAELFADVIAQVLPHYSLSELRSRYERVREISEYAGEPKRVCVLSRVTLGADVVVSSQVLGAAKVRFRGAQIYFVGPAKNAELFAADQQVRTIQTAYARSGKLLDRLLASESVRELVDDESTLVLDPDSRLTQLGLIPVCAEESYRFFESRSYGGESNRSLSELTADWIERTVGIAPVRPYLQPASRGEGGEITVSLGVGENSEKLVTSELELAAVERLVSLGAQVLVDRGGGGEESERVEKLVDALGRPANLSTHHGSFASFAGHVMRSRLYLGYDSAGQHVAAAAGVPLVTVFAGYASERTLERWLPTGAGPIHIVKIAQRDENDAVARTLEAITSAAAEAGLS
jgi:ADP-heptose:LPS heptosyltransferase